MIPAVITFLYCKTSFQNFYSLEIFHPIVFNAFYCKSGLCELVVVPVSASYYSSSSSFGTIIFKITVIVLEP